MRHELAMTKEVRISDCDAGRRIRLSALITDLHELGEAQAVAFGLSRNELLEKGMCWVLYRQRIVMRKLPGYGETMRVTTWPAALQGPVFPRYFVLEDETGEQIGEAVTAWILMDVATRRPLRPTAIPGVLPVSDARENPLPLPGMLRIESAQEAEKRAVKYSDVDVNGHMNNTRYIDWTADVLPFDMLLKDGLHDIQVNYISEALPGEALMLLTAEADGGMLVTGRRADGKTVFEAKASTKA